jgi:predicted nucleotidyltransferase
MSSYSTQDHLEIQSMIKQVTQIDEQDVRNKHLRKISKIIDNTRNDVSISRLPDETLDKLIAYLRKISYRVEEDFDIVCEEYEDKKDEKLNNQERKYLKQKKLQSKLEGPSKELDISRVTAERSKSGQGKKKKVRRPVMIQ